MKRKRKVNLTENPDGTIPLTQHPKHELARSHVQARQLDMKAGIGITFETVVGPSEPPEKVKQ